MKKMKIFAFIFALLVIGGACKKDNVEVEPGVTPVYVRITDAPGNFQQVNIDIIGVEFKGDNGTTVNLNVNAGIYNLLDFVNGVDTLIAGGNFPSGTLSQIRLILGANNTVMDDSVMYPLSTPSAMQSGLKLNVHTTLTAGVAYNLLLDFDAGQSIVNTGNGEYILKPVIRVLDVAMSGPIHGSVSPPAALPATASATDGTNTYTTITDSTGSFLLVGIPAGTYSVEIAPQPPYMPMTITNVVVTVGNMTELGDLNF